MGTSSPTSTALHHVGRPADRHAAEHRRADHDRRPASRGSARCARWASLPSGVRRRCARSVAADRARADRRGPANLGPWSRPPWTGADGPRLRQERRRHRLLGRARPRARRCRSAAPGRRPGRTTFPLYVAVPIGAADEMAAYVRERRAEGDPPLPAQARRRPARRRGAHGRGRCCDQATRTS